MAHLRPEQPQLLIQRRPHLPTMRVQSRRHVQVLGDVTNFRILPIHQGAVKSIEPWHWQPGAGWMIYAIRAPAVVDLDTLNATTPHTVCTFYSAAAAQQALDRLLSAATHAGKPILVDLRELEVQDRDERVRWVLAEIERQENSKAKQSGGSTERQRVITLDTAEETAPAELSIEEMLRETHLGIPLMNWPEWNSSDDEHNAAAVEAIRQSLRGSLVSQTVPLRNVGVDFEREMSRMQAEQIAMQAVQTDPRDVGGGTPAVRTPPPVEPPADAAGDYLVRASSATAGEAVAQAVSAARSRQGTIPDFADRTNRRYELLLVEVRHATTREQAIRTLADELRSPDYSFSAVMIANILLAAGYRIAHLGVDMDDVDDPHMLLLNSVRTRLSHEVLATVRNLMGVAEQASAPEPRRDRPQLVVQEILDREAVPLPERLTQIAAWLRESNYPRDSPLVPLDDILAVVGTALTRAGVLPANLFDLVRQRGSTHTVAGTVTAAVIDVLSSLSLQAATRLLVMYIRARPALPLSDIVEAHQRLARELPTQAVHVLRGIFADSTNATMPRTTQEAAARASYYATILAAVGVTAASLRNYMGMAPPGAADYYAAVHLLMQGWGPGFVTMVETAMREDEQIRAELAGLAGQINNAAQTIARLAADVSMPANEFPRVVAEALRDQGFRGPSFRRMVADMGPATTALRMVWHSALSDHHREAILHYLDPPQAEGMGAPGGVSETRTRSEHRPDPGVYG